ncbi:MAG TPA: hypothetical protein IAB85_04695 [Candidatus Coprenecus merdigallinarum]|nr:hypothetical protein [Candidatus Coprenecus merdigallinarum]
MGFDIESDSEEVIVDTKSTDFSYLDRPMVLGDKLENLQILLNCYNNNDEKSCHSSGCGSGGRTAVQLP